MSLRAEGTYRRGCLSQPVKSLFGDEQSVQESEVKGCKITSQALKTTHPPAGRPVSTRGTQFFSAGFKLADISNLSCKISFIESNCPLLDSHGGHTEWAGLVGVLDGGKE